MGVLVAWLVYTFVLARMDVGAFDARFERVFAYIVMTVLSLAYAWSPLFRSTMLVAMTMAGSQQGQRVLMLHVTRNVFDRTHGPVANIVHNYGQGESVDGDESNDL
jgi:hypothetical protein